MSKLLPANFQGEKYGLSYRLVNEGDADVIIRLRNGARVGEFLHQTSLDVDVQKEWIRNYKVREKEGREYYFIFFKDDIPVALFRLYNINGIYATPGSWVIDPKYSSSDIALATATIVGEITFNTLEIEMTIFEVNKKNTQVIKYHKLMGAQMFSESETNYFFYKNKQIFEEKLNKFIKFLKQ